VTAARGRRRAVDALLDALPPLCLVVGKGGVGKTTCAVGLTSRFAARHERTLLVSTDPAGSLGAVLGAPLIPGERREIETLRGCAVLQLDSTIARAAFLARWRDTIVTIVDRGTYLDADDINGLVDAAFPGADEIFAMLALAELVTNGVDAKPSKRGWDRLIVDTAPTGHTLRLLALPETFDAMIALLEAMQSKHRFMVSALTHRYSSDAADEFLAAMRGIMGSLRSSLCDAARSAAVLVTRAEAVVISETRRYAAALAALDIALGGIVLNAVTTPVSSAAQRAISDLEDGPRIELYTLPRSEPPPVGVRAIGALFGKLQRVGAGTAWDGMVSRDANGLRQNQAKPLSSPSGGAQSDATLALLRALTIVAGKGGVGKTTVSCALALADASRVTGSQRVLLVSTDPAPSIGDALGIFDPDWARRTPEFVQDCPSLDIWQIDASTAFAELRERYRDRTDALFEEWVGRGVDVVRDREILRDLLALAPPGIDELYALSVLGEILDQRRYTRVIVDPAPTGHLLRLLEMPALALDWSHRLMRLLLKYREVAGLGDAAGELLIFSRRTRAFDQLLHDSARAGIVLVSLPEPIVEAESARLAHALREHGLAVLGLVLNRVPAPRLSPAVELGAGVTVVAPESNSPLVGVDAIADWCDCWRVRD
jgi:arsenite/tail-anchored protein-transporting ATPase